MMQINRLSARSRAGSAVVFAVLFFLVLCAINWATGDPQTWVSAGVQAAFTGVIWFVLTTLLARFSGDQR